MPDAQFLPDSITKASTRFRKLEPVQLFQRILQCPAQLGTGIALGLQASKRHEWSYESPIASIEVSSETAAKPQLIASLVSNEDSHYIDNSDPLRAHWMLEIKNGKRFARLRFVPLDVRGVEFVLRFPIASSRLDDPG